MIVKLQEMNGWLLCPLCEPGAGPKSCAIRTPPDVYTSPAFLEASFTGFNLFVLSLSFPLMFLGPLMCTLVQLMCAPACVTWEVASRATKWKPTRCLKYSGFPADLRWFWVSGTDRICLSKLFNIPSLLRLLSCFTLKFYNVFQLSCFSESC